MPTFYLVKAQLNIQLDKTGACGQRKGFLSEGKALCDTYKTLLSLHNNLLGDQVEKEDSGAAESTLCHTLWATPCLKVG